MLTDSDVYAHISSYEHKRDHDRSGYRGITRNHGKQFNRNRIFVSPPRNKGRYNARLFVVDLFFDFVETSKFCETSKTNNSMLPQPPSYLKSCYTAKKPPQRPLLTL